MSGSGRKKDEDEEGGGGWASTFLKKAVAATAAVAGSLYSIAKKAEAEEAIILYVDGSLLREREVPSAGCGGFISDSSGKWICGFAQKLNPNLRVDETEKEAILRGLLWVKEKGKRKVEVKSDNEGVVSSVNSGGRSNDPFVRRIRDLLNNPHWELATLTCIRGSSNGVADRLAHKAHSFTSFDLCQFDNPPENCTNILF